MREMQNKMNQYMPERLFGFNIFLRTYMAIAPMQGSIAIKADFF